MICYPRKNGIRDNIYLQRFRVASAVDVYETDDSVPASACSVNPVVVRFTHTRIVHDSST